MYKERETQHAIFEAFIDKEKADIAKILMLEFGWRVIHREIIISAHTYTLKSL
jgi:hypothetical protein